MLDDHEGEVAADVGLVEDEGLLLRGGALVLALLLEGRVEGLLLAQFLFEQRDGLEEGVPLLLPLPLPLPEGLHCQFLVIIATLH